MWSECTVYGILIKASLIFLLLESKLSKARERNIGQVSVIVSFITVISVLPWPCSGS